MGEEDAGPIARTVSAPTRQTSFSFGSGLRRQTSVTGTGRRKSATGWLRSLGHKISGNAMEDHSTSTSPILMPTDPDQPPRRRSVPNLPTSPTSIGGPPDSAIGVGQRFRSSSVNKVSSVVDPLAPGGKSCLTSSTKRKIPSKQVGFAAETFANDPPQRIPPTKPRKGNVEFLSNGEISVKPRPWGTTDAWYHPYLEKNHRDLAENAFAKAHVTAEKLHVSMTKGGFLSSLTSSRDSSTAPDISADEEETEELELEKRSAFHTIDPKLDIDAVKHSSVPQHHHHVQEGNDDDEDNDDYFTSDEDGTVPSELAKVPPPDIVYTRCCHLREIMPIRNMLKQLQGQLAPVPLLRIANTKPTMVEILALSDFLTAVPVVCLVLDNHIFTAEMIRLILAGLQRSRDLARISFVNTDLDNDAWRYMIDFLKSHRGTLISLDLSCTKDNPLGDKLPTITRRGADWKSLSEALETTGTLEELHIDGTHISSPDFIHLISRGFKSGRILSVSNNDLDHNDVEAVVDWASSPDSKAAGIALSGNDLSREWPQVERLLTNQRLYRLALRSTKLSVVQAEQFTNTLTADVASRSMLRSLDLSGNPSLFPSLLPRLVEVLPKFPSLARLQLDSCALSSESIVFLADSLCHCHKLVSVNVQGNSELSENACVALCVAVQVSQSIVTVEADVQRWPKQLQERLTQSCFQNLQGATNSGPSCDNNKEHPELRNFRGEVKRVTAEVTQAGPGITPKIIEDIENTRKRVRKLMHDLLEKKRLGPLSVADRETLICLYFFDSSLDRLSLQCAAMTGSKSAAAAIAAGQGHAILDEEEVSRW